MRFRNLAPVFLVMLLAGCIPPPPTSSNDPTPDNPPAPTTDEPTPPMERVAAEAGVGKKGQSLKNETGMVVEPVKQLIKFEQKSIFDFQIKPALELYKASNGSYPATHEEFMQKIIQANGIQLPELPTGQKYVFDPEQGQLMVERPQQ